MTLQCQRLARERRELYVAWQAAMQAYQKNLMPEQLQAEQQALRKKKAVKLKKVARIMIISNFF